jgi:hypothetical protein
MLHADAHQAATLQAGASFALLFGIELVVVWKYLPDQNTSATGLEGAELQKVYHHQVTFSPETAHPTSLHELLAATQHGDDRYGVPRFY